MPPQRRSRQKSPCSPQTKRVPKYKQLARNLPANARETLPRFRYQVNPHGENRPCGVIGDDAEGRTNCYNPKAHSSRRRTCNLLLDPDNPLHDFEPGLYLVPGPRFRDQTLVCSAVDILMYNTEDVDTRHAPPTQPVVVLGPFVHPVTGLLSVKCILLSALEEAGNIASFGQTFQTMDTSERGVMVPDRDMIMDLMRDVEQANAPNAQQIVGNLFRVNRQLTVKEKRLEDLDDACSVNADLQKRVRTICKCFYEMALYFRRYAGPGRKVPLDLLQGVGDASNPLSSSLEGRFVTSTMTGVRLNANGGGGAAQSADFVMQPEGTLTNMSQAYAHSILMIYDSLSANQQELLRKAFQLGTPFRIVNGNGRFYLDDADPNIYNGNPSHMQINLFDMCYGDTNNTAPARGFYAMASVHGTRTYCVQIAAIQIIRTVQTILPYIYRSRPAWALVDGEFDNVHT